jgi:hypothetical protein
MENEILKKTFLTEIINMPHKILNTILTLRSEKKLIL